MDYVNFGVVGCGMAGSFHVLGVKNYPNAKLRYIAAYDVNERNLKRFTRRNKLKAYTEIEEFLKDDEIEAVLLSVPHYLHAPLTKKIAAAGKHVIKVEISFSFYYILKNLGQVPITEKIPGGFFLIFEGAIR
ncbi:MAG: Gfo/Idh/MocA family protein [Candidatus Hodarchaeota archaeon]